jgi:gamma-glutamyltranspeptidase/glutathione hydrolase
MRQFDRPGRSLAIGQQAMAATSSPQATLAAIETLKNGGNAADAAVTAAAILCITEPHMTGIGGDGFALIGKPDGTILGLNGSGRSAKAATPEWLARASLTEIEPHSPHSVTVPGVIDTWDKLLKAHGTMSLEDALQPAIALAEAGVPTLPRVARDWPESEALLRSSTAGAKHYLRNGKSPMAGDLMQYPALAKTLRKIAKGGCHAFYEGEIADDIVSELKTCGSLITKDDLKANKADWVEPIGTDFADHAVWEIPPSGQGLTVLITLNILKCFDMKHLDPEGPQRRHLEIEALKRAWVLRNRHIADPDFAEVPVKELLSAATAQKMADSINSARASDIKFVMPGSDTVYLAVVDKNRLAVSFINSIYWNFGSGIVTDKTGITLQNRGSGFVTNPNHPNCIGPAKRPLHTIIPAMATHNGKLDMIFGVMGGNFQPMGHVNVVLNRYLYGMDPQESLDFARCFPENGSVEVEAGIAASIISDLAAMGHGITHATEPLGGGQIIAIDHARGLLLGGSDPRKDGFALGL